EFRARRRPYRRRDRAAHGARRRSGDEARLRHAPRAPAQARRAPGDRGHGPRGALGATPQRARRSDDGPRTQSERLRKRAGELLWTGDGFSGGRGATVARLGRADRRRLRRAPGRAALPRHRRGADLRRTHEGGARRRAHRDAAHRLRYRALRDVVAGAVVHLPADVAGRARSGDARMNEATAQYFAWRGASLAVPALPSPVDPLLSRGLGAIAYAAAPNARAAVRANLTVVAPGLAAAERETLVRRAFVNQARNYLTTLRLPQM